MKLLIATAILAASFGAIAQTSTTTVPANPAVIAAKAQIDKDKAAMKEHAQSAKATISADKNQIKADRLAGDKNAVKTDVAKLKSDREAAKSTLKADKATITTDRAAAKAAIKDQHTTAKNIVPAK